MRNGSLKRHKKGGQGGGGREKYKQKKRKAKQKGKFTKERSWGNKKVQKAFGGTKRPWMGRLLFSMENFA